MCAMTGRTCSRSRRPRARGSAAGRSASSRRIPGRRSPRRSASARRSPRRCTCIAISTRRRTMRGPASCWSRCACPNPRRSCAATRTSSRAGSNSAWPSPWRSPASPTRSCSTSPPPGSTSPRRRISSICCAIWRARGRWRWSVSATISASSRGSATGCRCSMPARPCSRGRCARCCARPRIPMPRRCWRRCPGSGPAACRARSTGGRRRRTWTARAVPSRRAARWPRTTAAPPPLPRARPATGRPPAVSTRARPRRWPHPIPPRRAARPRGRRSCASTRSRCATTGAARSRGCAAGRGRPPRWTGSISTCGAARRSASSANRAAANRRSCAPSRG